MCGWWRLCSHASNVQHGSAWWVLWFAYNHASCVCLPTLVLALQEVAPDAEILAQSAAHMMAREELALKLEVLGRQMEAKQKRLLALQSAADIEVCLCVGVWAHGCMCAEGEGAGVVCCCVLQ